MLKSFRFSPITTIICLTLSALMLRASSWQWDRYKQKTELIETYEKHSSVSAIKLPELAPPNLVSTANLVNTTLANTADSDKKLQFSESFLKEATYRKVHLSGEFDYANQLIVTNRKDIWGPGHLLFAPFKLAGSEYRVLVSRGFIPFSERDAENWKKYDFIPPVLAFDAVMQPAKKSLSYGPKNPEVGPEKPYARTWFYEEISKMAEQLPYPIIDNVYFQQLGGPASGEFPAQSIRVEVPPSTHFGYTIEWAILSALSLIIGFVLQAMPRRNHNRKLLG